LQHEQPTKLDAQHPSHDLLFRGNHVVKIQSERRLAEEATACVREQTKARSGLKTRFLI